MAVVEERVEADVSEEAQSLSGLLERQRAAFLAEGAPSLEHRKTAIEKVRRILTEYKHDFAQAISDDFGNRAVDETMMAEVFLPLNTVKNCAKNVAKWMRPKRTHIDLLFRPGRGRIHYQPKGVIGIMGPWNYPLYLSIVPIVQALTAGNRVMYKPSELTPRFAELFKKAFAEHFSEEEVAIVMGDAGVGAAFSALPFDHIFFTGSTRVGRFVMQAAAKNLTPVTLELGGKSPLVIEKNFSLARVAPSLAAGKLFNAGQTCVAPDFVLVHDSQRDALVEAFGEQAAKLYPTLKDNGEYTSIVSDGHYERITELVNDARAQGASVHVFNPMEEDLSDVRKIAPTLVLDATDDMSIMQEEIFGPVLLVKTYSALDEAIDFINARPRPLAQYYFGEDAEQRDKVLTSTTFGGGCVNTTLFHLAQEELPFGGIGPSGMGSYHGYAGFKTFSHEKAMFYQCRINGFYLFRPPYGKIFHTLIKYLTK